MILNPKDITVAPPQDSAALPHVAKPSTRVIFVRLDQLVLRYEDFSHRGKEALEPAAVQTLLDSIKTEGLRHPPEVFRQDEGPYVVVTGHRRVICLRLLARDGVARFAPDMEVEVVELLGTTPLDRLAWSVADNETRLNLTPINRITVVTKFLKAGMSDERGAAALGLSPSQDRPRR